MYTISVPTTDIFAKNTEIPAILYVSFHLTNFLFYFIAAFFNVWIELYDTF